jgi:hypothetical protein
MKKLIAKIVLLMIVALVISAYEFVYIDALGWPKGLYYFIGALAIVAIVAIIIITAQWCMKQIDK